MNNGRSLKSKVWCLLKKSKSPRSDSTTIATASFDNTAKIWGLQNQRKQQAFTWFKYNLFPEQAAVIDRAYEQKLAG